jgi:hypothetical protein
MSTNHPLFEQVFSGTPEPTGPPLTGSDLKRSGMESVVSHTPEWYRDKFVDAVKKMQRGSLFTVEDVRAVIGDPPSEVNPNCMGGLMRRAAGQKLIVRTTERRKAKRVSLHSSELAVWKRI